MVYTYRTYDNYKTLIRRITLISSSHFVYIIYFSKSLSHKNQFADDEMHFVNSPFSPHTHARTGKGMENDAFGLCIHRELIYLTLCRVYTNKASSLNEIYNSFIDH